MPSHLYTTRHVPPRWYDIVLAHALEVSVAAFSLLGGIMVAFNADTLNVFADTTPLRFLPFHLVLGISVFLIFGGGAALLGVLIRKDNIRVELNIEQTGWVILAVGWAAYGWSAVYYADGAAMSYLFAGAVTVGSALRAAALFIIEKQLENAVLEGVETGSDREQENHDD